MKTETASIAGRMRWLYRLPMAIWSARTVVLSILLQYIRSFILFFTGRTEIGMLILMFATARYQGLFMVLLRMLGVFILMRFSLQLLCLVLGYPTTICGLYEDISEKTKIDHSRREEFKKLARPSIPSSELTDSQRNIQKNGFK